MRTRYLIRDSSGSVEVDADYILNNKDWFYLSTTMIVDNVRIEEYVSKKTSIITVQNRKWWQFFLPSTTTSMIDNTLEVRIVD